ncbi:uncharacterized protein LOC129842600 [Salvelinus fontinalis]|uniref:uncharacterized protein LOC129842600 n=1 Tax=Salvelinus fontinalis TaxID=8038 RepID=UPI002486C990|nr:uncharacterized protein LOC129842600 [Salvelinus fontinalis]
MSLSGESEKRGTASKRKYSDREEGATPSKKSLPQNTSSKSVQKPRAESPTPSLLSMKSNQSMGNPPTFSQEPLPDDNKEVESLDSEDALKITHNLLDRRSQTLLTVQQDIKAKLKHKYQHISEGIGHHGNQSLFKDIYTELYITEGGSGGLNNEHEVRQIEMASKKQTTQETPIKCNDIFKPLPGQDKPIRTVLTKGIAGIGKTVSVQKVILDWAEGKANQDVHLLFPLPFRDLNQKKDQYSLMQLLSHYFSELKEIDSIEDGETKTVFIFDGLDECRLPLDFKNKEKCCDVTNPTSVDVLLTNLIKGNLLPSAHLWITTRPAAANQIPPDCINRVTEVRGFNDPQKEEYFRKKIPDQNLANDIIKHMKTSRSLHIMCHMPVFCWISATVLEMILKEAWKDEVPKTLTQMYSHFILIQIIVKNRKYNKGTETNPKELSQSDKEMILKLAKLAFQQLQKGNLIFYEEDLRECGLEVTEASEYSALCTEFFKEESGLDQEKVYSFVHLSIQEFLAAVHALESCLDKKENVFSPKAVTSYDDEVKESIIKAVTSDDEEESIRKAVTSDDEEESIRKAVTSDDEEESIRKAVTSDDEEESIRKAVTSDDEEESIRKAVTSDDEEESIRKAVTSDDEEESIRKAVTSDDEEESIRKAVTSDDEEESIRKAVTSDDEEESIRKAVTSDDEEESIRKAVTSDDEEESIRKAVTSDDEEESIRKAVTSDDEEESIRKAVTSDDEEESIRKAVTSDDEEESIRKAVTSDDEEESIRKAVTSDDEEESIRKAVTSDDEEESIRKAVTSDDEEESIRKAVTSDDEEESIRKAVTSDDEDYDYYHVENKKENVFSPTSDEDKWGNVFSPTSDKDKWGNVFSPTSDKDKWGNVFSPTSDKDKWGNVFSPTSDKDKWGNVFSPTSDDEEKESIQLSDLHKSAVDQALKSKNGHLDLFLRFLLGLSLESNQNLLRGLLTQTGSTTQTNEETVESTVEYLSDKLEEESSPERIINLFHCLNELGSNSLVEDMQTSLRSGTLSETILKPDQCSALAYLLLMSEEVLEEFDLKTYNTSEEGYQRLLPVVKTCKRALLDGCELTYKSCETLASALQTPNSPLRELDLSYNDLGDRGVELLCVGLTSPLCNIQTLVLGQCGLTEGCCSDLASVLSSPNSQLKQLELRNNDLQDSGVTLLSAGLEDPDCKLHTLGLLDWRIQTLLSAGLEDPDCKLHTLGLSGCLVTEEGCAALSSALRSNPSHLKELDLSYNHPGDSAGGLLSAALVDPTYKLMKLNVDHGGECWLKSGLRKYACHLTLDPNTANPNLVLSEGNRKVTWVKEEQHYEDHPDRFDYHPQVLCREGLSGCRYYWEVERDCGMAYIGVVYEGLKRKGDEDDSRIGSNRESWCLVCSYSGSTFFHAGVSRRSIPRPDSNRVGVYLDWPAGTLTFYSVSSSGTLTHLYTEHTTFTEPLYPGFKVYSSSVTLCQIDDQHIQRDHDGECCVKPGPEDTRDHGGESWIKPGPENTRDHGGESWIKPGPENTRDHGGESCIKPGPENTRDHGGECWIKPGPENTRDHGGECWIKSGPEKMIPQSCKTCDHVEDSTHWLQIEPLTSTVQGVTMFRHRTPKGSYECTVSGLRWLCERDVILKYHFRNWDPYSQLLKDMQYTQGGPLLDITMELGELEEVHLPHCVCLGTNPSLRNEMKILHVEEHGVSLEEVHEVTRFHAKVLHPKFSAISVILSYIFSWNVDVHCDVVLYMAVKRSTVISRLYLLLRNSSQKEAVQEREKNQVSQGYSEFLLPSPNGSLKLNSWFALKNPHSTSIYPEKIQLLPADTTPSCCQMIMGNTGVDIEMELIGDDERTVWKSVVSKDVYSKDYHPTGAVLGAGGPAESSLTGSPEHQLRSVRTKFVKQVSKAVLNGLLDGLLQHTVINQEEMESVKVIAERAEKARDIIDMVLRKGTESCSRMINLLGELDHCLCSQLQINSVGVPT